MIFLHFFATRRIELRSRQPRGGWPEGAGPLSGQTGSRCLPDVCPLLPWIASGERYVCVFYCRAMQYSVEWREYCRCARAQPAVVDEVMPCGN